MQVSDSGTLVCLTSSQCENGHSGGSKCGLTAFFMRESEQLSKRTGHEL